MTSVDTPSAPVVDIDAPRHPDLQTLYQYWLARRGARAMPTRADINPADIKPLLPDVILWSAVEPYLIRLVGDHIVRFVGANYTGFPATQEMPPEAARVMTSVFTTVINTRSPSFRTGKAFWRPEKSYRKFESCLLPLSADGETVDLILGGLKFDFD